jgi:acyl dehydratase
MSKLFRHGLLTLALVFGLVASAAAQDPAKQQSFPTAEAGRMIGVSR